MRSARPLYRDVRMAPTSAAVGPAPVMAGYYQAAPTIAVVLIVIVATRLHEVIPYLWLLKPALTVSVAGATLLALRTQPQVLSQAIAHPLFRLLVALMAWAVLTAPLALWPSLALNMAVSLMLPILLLTFVILCCEPNTRNLQRLKVAIFGGTAAHGAILLLLGGASSTSRMESTASLDSNDLAMLMVVAFPFALSTALRSRGRRRWLALFATLILLIVVIYTGSRGGTLALVAAVVVYVAFAKNLRRGLAFGGLLMSAALTWVLAPPSFRDRMATIANLDSDYNTFDYNGRKAIWARARGYIKQNPVAGVGIYNFSVAEGAALAAAGERGKWSTTHNTYLQITSELGIVGAAMFLGILGLAFTRAMRLRQPAWGSHEISGGQPELIAALVGFAVGGYFLSHAYFYALYALIAVTIFAERVVAVQSGAPMAVAPTGTPIRGSRGFRSARAAQWAR